MEDINDFSGVFYFSNNSKEDFTALWNNKEYIFPAETCSPMIIQGETPENVQEIRKRFAYKWAEKEWYKGSEYKKMSKMGGGLPPTRDDSVLEPLVQMCLKPLPIKAAKVSEGPKEKRKYTSKVVKKETNLNKEFEDQEIVELGEQPK